MGAGSSRYRQIGAVLRRHGLGVLAGVLGLGGLVPFHRGALGHARQEDPYTNPEHVRVALEELGPTFVKLGQILSTRHDLLPAAWVAEFAKLQDDVAAAPWEGIRDVLREELGADPEHVFAQFDPVPLAAASIGQAYAATLHDGTEVVVKVRRPGVVAQVHEDLDILRNLADRADRRWDAIRQYDLPGLVEEFSRTLRAELDYLQEARNAERFAQEFAHAARVRIPRVHGETTTSRVLTLERMSGVRIDDLEGLDAAGIDRVALARLGADIVLTMVFDNRFFHADPHPGNMFVQPDGALALIDFGMVGGAHRTDHGRPRRHRARLHPRRPGHPHHRPDRTLPDRRRRRPGRAAAGDHRVHGPLPGPFAVGDQPRNHAPAAARHPAAAPAAPSEGDGAAVQSADDGRRDRGAAGSGLPDARRPAALR
ncbi:ABC1 kinase family protein [Microbacterium aurum]